MSGFENFMQSPITAVVGIGLLVIAGIFVIVKAVKGRENTAPETPMINTGEPWTPGENKQPADNRPKPPTPPNKNDV